MAKTPTSSSVSPDAASPASTADGATGSPPALPDTLQQLIRSPSWGVGGSYVLDPATGERTPATN